MPSDRVSGYRAPTNHSTSSPSREVRRQSNSGPRNDSTRPQTPDRTTQAGTPADLAEASRSSDFRQQVEEASNLGLPFVAYTNSSGQVVFFNRSQLQNAGMWPSTNNPPSAEGEVPEPFVSAQSEDSDFGGGTRRSQHTITSSFTTNVSAQNYNQNNPRSINPNQSNSFDWVTQNRSMWEGLNQNNLMQDEIRESKQKAQEAEKSFVKIKQIALMVMMGDFVGALRAMTNEQEKYTKQIARAYLKQMNKSKDVKAMMYKTMANYSPPMNTGSTDPQTIANFQNKQAKYSQVMGLMTNTLQEVSTSDRQLTDGYTELLRKLTESYELLSNAVEIDSRAKRAITK